MNHDKAMIWSFLLVVITGLGVHVFLLWRDLLIDSLRLRILAIEAELSELSQADGQTHRAVLRFRRLLENSRCFAGSLIITRIILANVLLRSSSASGGTCRDALLAMEPARSREISLRLYADFEQAVVTRMTRGSPFFLLYCIYCGLVPARLASSTGLVPGLDLLEYTFVESESSPSEFSHSRH